MTLEYLAKVLAIVMMMAAECISFRAPNPVPKPEDRYRFGGESDTFAAITYWFPPLGVVRSVSFYTKYLVCSLSHMPNSS